MAKNPYKRSKQAVKRQYGTKNPRKVAKQMAYERLAKFKKDPSQFGLSQAERQGMVGEAMSAAGQAAAAQQAGMARQGMGQGGFQAGYMQQATRQLGAAPAQAAAQASMQARALSEAKIQNAAQQTQDDIDEAFRKRLAARQQTMSDFRNVSGGLKDLTEAGKNVMGGAALGQEIKSKQ